MQIYRLYLISPSGHVTGPKLEMSSVGDRDAIREARMRANAGHDIELWQGHRLVAYVTGEERHAH